MDTFQNSPSPVPHTACQYKALSLQQRAIDDDKTRKPAEPLTLGDEQEIMAIFNN